MYYEYGTDKKLHYRKRPDRSVREYIINPYQMAAKEGKYYLICNYDKYNNISNYRINRIAERKILDTPAKPFEKLDGAEKQRLNLSKYMGEHIYMFSSKTVRVKFRITKPMISDVIDMFGNDVRFTDETDSFVTVTANANEMSMLQFVKSFAPDVVVLEPKQLEIRLKMTWKGR
ncbi:WYL domain-containing protein [Ruminococcus sp.]|uniref:WYL domain-containing protein n=1 Tax=Ruminococcus sp. TaxID=41978 RepID=UPI0035205F57